MKWTREELQQMNQRIRNLITTHKAIYPRNDKDKLYASINEKGRGHISIEDIMDASMQGLEEYIKSGKKD